MRVAICGAGDMGERHFAAFSAIDGVKVAAVSDVDEGKARRVASGGAKVYPSSEEMIEKSGVDCVSIATPTAFHARLAIQALGKGMHVFCEKPMARTVEEGEAMAKAAGKSGKVLAIGYSTRFNGAYVTARDMIRAGKLGKPGTIRTSRCATQEADWHGDIAGNGGAVFELMTHDLDWLAWTLGPVERVFARGLAKGKARVDRDYALAVIRFGSGTIAHLEASFAEMDGFHCAFEAAGDAGLLSYDSRRATTLEARLVTPDGLRRLSEAPQGQRPLEKEITAFVAAVQDGRGYAIPADEALVALRLAAAVEKSIETGQPVMP